jgi:CHAD domain-containing protein
MISEAQYTIGESALPEGIAQSLQALLPVRVRPIVRHRMVLLDTFNGSIAAAGGRLTARSENGGALLEWHAQAGQVRLEVPVKTAVAFAWDLPCGPLRSSLQPIIDVRRLLPQVEVELHGRTLDVLDNDRKTVARIRIEEGRARTPGRAGAWQCIPALVTLSGLRGYDAAYERLLRIVESRPELNRASSNLQAIALHAVGASAPRDVSRFEVALEPSVRAAVGARQIHQALLDIMVANEPGVHADLDTEFLHDYRVSLRRTRSLLGQIKEVFPPGALTHFRTEFQWLARSTSTKRDLDVLLLSLRELSENLPAGDLADLLAFLSRKQEHEQALLQRVLESKRYKDLLASWRAFLQEPNAVPEPENAARPLLEVTSRRILRLHRRLVDQATAIHDETPVDAIHQLRIEAKKLRYMIDATRSLHDCRDLDRIIDSLKKVQSVLGDFNDAQVQERSLLDAGGALVEAGIVVETGALLSVERLAEDARNRAAALRPEVDRELARFCKSGMRADFCRLFKRTTEREELS